MKAFITGGAGFIGSHLAEELLSRGNQVYIIDDLSTGNIDNIEHLKNDSNFRYAVDSIKNEQLMAKLIDKCDLIYHLAAAVGVRLVVESPVRTIETNFAGTEIVLKLANKKKKKIVIISSSEVYGKGKDITFREDSDIILGSTDKGRWSYGCSKVINEFLALAYYKENKLPIVIVRLFNTSGPRQTGDYGMVIPTFVKQALMGHPITVYGDGKQTRCFSNVKDVVRVIIELSQHPNAVGEIFNIGSTEKISIEDLAKLVKKLTRSKSTIVYIPYDEAYEEGFEDVKDRVPDVSKLQNLIGFKLTIDLEGTIRSMIDYYRQIHNE